MSKTTKLTLSINQDVITKAKKELPVSTGMSISKLVERYLERLLSKTTTKSDTPITDSLIGIANPKNKDIDIKKIKYEYLKEKYL